MKLKFLLIALSIFVSFSFFAERKINIFMAGDSTMCIMASNKFPKTGWGMPFVCFWDPTKAIVVNRAKSGRSTKTFISEGLWKSITDNALAGDYVIIQFGTNDESVTSSAYTPPAEFKANLTLMITEARGKGAIPILLTPVSKRKFSSTTGKVLETHPVYSPLVREVAVEQNVLFIDGDRLSQDLFNQWGSVNSKWLFLKLAPGEHPNYPNGEDDNTHMTELGARLFAQIVLKQIQQIDPALATKVVNYVPPS